MPGHRNAWNAPKQAAGVCSGKLPTIIPNSQVSRIALRNSYIYEVKKCFGKGFGWICALNRWSVQERAHISFCPKTLQVLIYLTR